MDIIDPTDRLVDQLMKLDLPAGVDVEIKLNEHSAKRDPDSSAGTAERREKLGAARRFSCSKKQRAAGQLKSAGTIRITKDNENVSDW